MKKIIIGLLMIVIIIGGAYIFNVNFNSSLITTGNTDVKNVTETTSKVPLENILEDTSVLSTNDLSEGESVPTSTTVEKTTPGDTAESFFQTNNIDELIYWIKNAKSNDSRRHFLETARRKNTILVVETTDKDYELDSITVHPNYEYMTYIFKKGKNYICIIVNLSDSMKQQMSSVKQKRPLKQVISEYNNKLKKTYKDFQYKKGKAEILGTSIVIFYNDGGNYEKINGDKKFISPGAFFEIKDIEVQISLYADLKGVKWDNKYLELFHFKEINLN